jgi:hypothetical protein
MTNWKLPRSVQEIADVIGAERALFLIGMLPRCYMPDRRKRETERGGHSERLILYVPKNLKPDHQLVRILGWHDALRLARAFPGEILCPGNCGDVYRRWRDSSLRDMAQDGVPNAVLAEWFGLTERQVRNVIRSPLAASIANADGGPENPQEEPPVASNDNRADQPRASAMAA